LLFFLDFYNFPFPEVPEEVIYVRKKLQAVEVDIDREFKESVWVKLNLKGNDKLLFGCVYKSLSSKCLVCSHPTEIGS
jgi:hypothetical protein